MLDDAVGENVEATAAPAGSRAAATRSAARLIEQAADETARRNHSSALRFAERALELDPASPDALGHALYCASKLERADAFGRHARAALALARADRPRLSKAKIGGLALRAGAHELAARIGGELLTTDPASPAGRFLVAATLWEAGREQEAERLIEAGLAPDADGRTPPAGVRTAIDYWLRVGEPARAERLLCSFDAPDPWAELHVAEELERREDPVRALELVRHAQTRGFGDARLDARLDALERRCRPLAAVLEGTWRRRPLGDCAIAPVKGRVLHLVSRSLPYHRSGGTYRTHYIGRAQRAAGLDPVFMTAVGFPRTAGHDAQATTELDGILYVHAGLDRTGAPPLEERLCEQVEALLALTRRLRPAVLHAASTYANGLVALEVGAAAGIPVVYEVRSFPEERLRRSPGSRALTDRGAARRELERRCVVGADHVVTLGAEMKRCIVDRGVDPARVSVIPNGVDAAMLEHDARADRLVTGLGIQPGDIVLGYVSTFQPWEDIDRIIDATAALHEAGYPVRALLVGDGPAYEDLVRRADEREIRSRVIFAGRVDHARVADYYRLIDLFVCPRAPGGTSELVTPLKPYEAMALGCAVVVSDTAALREIVEDGVTGRTFRAGETADLVAVCAQLVDHPGERARLAAAGREWVMRERTWQANGRRYRALYEQLGVA